MTSTNRRTFIVAAGGSAAAAAVAPTVLGGTAQAAPDAAPGEGGAAEHLVAYVDSPTSGHVTLMRGEDEVTVHDPDLVRRLTRAARG